MKSFGSALLALAACGCVAVLTAPTAAMARGCNKFALPESFALKQWGGLMVTFRLSADPKGKVTGSGFYRFKSGTIRSGSFDGRVLNFSVSWSDGGSGSYRGSIDRSRKLVGVARGGDATRFESIDLFECSV